jgi:hypothetical protein
MRKPFLIGIILCLCAVVVPATASGAAARRSTGARATARKATAGTSGATVTATPSTGLLDQQTVEVSASGLKAKTRYVLIECQAGATDPSGCGLVDVEPLKSDATGSFDAPYVVARMISLNNSGPVIDCAVQACVLAVGTIKGKFVADTSISFEDIVVVPPALSAVPSSGLRDGQNITLSGTGFSPNAFVEFIECESTAPTSCDVNTIYPAFSGPDGTFSTTYPVTRVIANGEGPVDCAQTTTCVIMATNESNPAQVASAPISFADVPIKTPKLMASPSTGLDDGDNVTVAGKGFGHHHEIGLTECVAGSTDINGCVGVAGLGNAAAVKANGAGRFSTTFNVSRVLTLFGATIDCAKAPGCVIGAIDLSRESESVTSVAPISFDPSVPPLPPLNLAVHIDPTGTIVAGGPKADQAQITGTMTCDRTTPLAVGYQVELTEPVGNRQAGALVTGVASCASGGVPFTVTLRSGHRHGSRPYGPGIAGLLMAVSAVSGSATVNTTLSASITLQAPSTS